MTDRSLGDPVYKGNDVAKDFGAEARSHEVGLKMWEIYKERKEKMGESISSEHDPQTLIMDVFRIFSYDDLRALRIRESRGDIEALVATPDLFYSVVPKDISGPRKTTAEVSNLTEDVIIDPEDRQILVFLRNVFAVFLGFVKSSITEEINARIIEDRKMKIEELLGRAQEIPDSQ